MKTTHLLAAALLLAAAAPAWAGETLRVPQDFLTISLALDNAFNGDTIVVSKRTYQENVVVSGFTDLTIKGKRGPTVDAQGSGACLNITNCIRVTVSGMRFVNAGLSGVLVRESTDVEITKCRVTDAAGHGIRDDGSTGLVISKTRIQDTGGDGVSLSSGNPALATHGAEVSRCKIINPGDDGVDLHGDGNLVFKCTVSGAREDGFEVDSDERGQLNVFDRCKAIDSADRGFAIHGNNQTLRRNKVIRTLRDDAFALAQGEFHFLEKNTAIRPAFDGFWINAGSCTLIGNKAKEPTDDGFHVNEGGGLYQSNKSTKARDNGFEVVTSRSTFTKNKATKSGSRDLHDSSGGNNDYAPDNKFPDTLIDP